MQITKNISYRGAVIFRTMDGLYVARSCNSCGKILPASKFKRITKGTSLNSDCKPCDLAKMLARIPSERTKETAYKRGYDYRVRNAKRTDTQIREKRKARHPLGVVTCSKCKQDKPFKEFYKARANPNGLMYRCIDCYTATKRK